MSGGQYEKKGKRFYAEYTSPDGKQHTPGGYSFATRTDAHAWLAAERRLVDAGRDHWTPPKHRARQTVGALITVEQWMRQYLDHRSHGGERYDCPRCSHIPG